MRSAEYQALAPLWMRSTRTLLIALQGRAPWELTEANGTRERQSP
jgi:hypothetical protein